MTNRTASTADSGAHGARSRSAWMETAASPSFAPLGEDIDCDVCIIGGGISGLSTAYLLTREGLSVALLEDGVIGGGESERTTAHLSDALDEGFVELEKTHGAEGARLAAESHGKAIDLIEEIVKRETIDCDFRRLDGYLFPWPEESEADMREDMKPPSERVCPWNS